jgi:hypothetical protein
LYDDIESFPKEKTINTPLHVRNVQIKGNGMYIPT